MNILNNHEQTDNRKGLLQFVQPCTKQRDIAISECWSLNAGEPLNSIEAEQAESRWLAKQ